MGLEVFELDFQQSQERLIEINQPDEIANMAPTTDLAIRIPHGADGTVIDALHRWLDTHGAGLETLAIDAKWIYWDRLPALDLSACRELLGLWVRGLNLSPQLLEHQRLQYLSVMQCLMAIEEGGLRIDGENLPSLTTCSFSDTKTGASDVTVADAQHLTSFGFDIDLDYADGEDPTTFSLSNCPALARAGIALPYDLTVEVWGDLPSLAEVTINAPEHEFDFVHERCSEPLLQSTVLYYDDETDEEPTVPIDDWDGQGSVYWFSYRFRPG